MKKVISNGVKYAQAALFFIATGALSPMAIAAMTEPYISYTVKEKDTLSGLTRSLLLEGKKWSEVAKLNGLKNPNLIRPGQMLEIPKSLLNFANLPKVATPGRVVSVYGDVRIGAEAAQGGASVPEGARVQTGEGSSAVLLLGDGSRMQLMPRTLAEITTQHGYALRDPSTSASTTWFSGAIRLVEGVMDALADKRAQRLTPFEVRTLTSLVGIRGTEFRVAYEDPANKVARTEVLEGKVRTDNTTVQGAGADVGAGFGVAIKPGERDVRVVALLRALTDDQLPAQVVRSAAPALQAQWTVGTLAGAVSYRAQLATDETFAQIQSDIKSPTPAINISALPNGIYWARVRGVDSGGIEGFNAARRIEIKTIATALVWPSEMSIGATAQFTSEGTRLKVFTQSVDAPKQLVVQLATDAAFTAGVQSLPLGADGQVLLRNLTPGLRYYVRFNDPAALPVAQSGAAPSVVYALDIPGNWGVSVLDMAQALQRLQ